MPKLKFGGPFIGIQRNLNANYISRQEAEDALNVNLDKGTLARRPGYSQAMDYHLSGSILGLYEWLKQDGSYAHLVKAAGTLFIVDPVTATSTQLSTGLSSSELACFATINNRVYIADGSGLKATDGTSVFSAAIVRPNAAPTVALVAGGAGSGIHSGDYDYKYTFYSSTWGQESPASDASAVTNMDSQNVQITMATAVPGGDARVDKKRVYRRKVSAAESEWSFLVETTIGDSVHTDVTRDNDIDFERIAPLSFTESSQNFRYIASQAGVVFLTGNDAFPNRVYYTLANQPYEIDSFLEVGTGADADPITGIWAFQGMVFIFKRRSIWSLSGNSRDTFYLRQVTKGVGCANHFTIVEVDEFLYFLGERTFYVFDGTDARDIGEPASQDVLSRNFSRDRFAVGANAFDQHAIIWSLTGNGAAQNSILYAYFYANSKRAESPSWCPWSFGTKSVSAMSLLYYPNAGKRQLTLGFDDGLGGVLGGNDDEGIQIQYLWRTSKHDAGEEDFTKRWGEMVTEFEKAPSTSLLDVNFYLDDGGQTHFTVHDSSDPIFRKAISRSSRDIRLEFSSYQDQPLEILSFSVVAEPAGRA